MDSQSREAAIRKIIGELAPSVRPREALGPVPTPEASAIGSAARRGYMEGYRAALKESGNEPQEKGDDDE